MRGRCSQSHPTKCIVGIQVLPGFPFSLRPSCMSAFLLSLSYVFLSVDAEIAFGRWRFYIPSLATQCSWMADTFVSLALLPWDNLQVSMGIGSSHCSFFVFNLSSKFVVTAPFGWFLQSSFNSNNLCAVACEFSYKHFSSQGSVKHRSVYLVPQQTEPYATFYDSWKLCKTLWMNDLFEKWPHCRNSSHSSVLDFSPSSGRDPFELIYQNNSRFVLFK